MGFGVVGAVAGVAGGALSFLGAREQADAIEAAGENNRFLFNSGLINSSASPFANITSFGPGNQIAAFGNVGLNGAQAAINPASFDFSSLTGGQPAVGSPAALVPPSTISSPVSPSGSVGAVDQLSSQGRALVGGQSQNTVADNANFADGLRINDPSASLGINASLGNLNPAFDGLTALATQGIGQAGLAGITPEIQQAFNNQQAAFGAQVNGDFGTLDALSQGTGQQFGFANQALSLIHI